MPKPEIDQIFIGSGNSIIRGIQGHHLIKKHQLLCLNKLDTKELNNMQLLANFLKPISQAYFENVFARHVFGWNDIYTSPTIVPTDSRLRIFQYKILHDILYPNKKLFQFNKTSYPERFFCKCEVETTINLFYISRKTQALWKQLPK